MKTKHASRIGYVAAAALPMCLVLLALLTLPRVTFNQWDNHELFTPIVWQSQTRLMAGDFPHWTHSQHMGQPVHAFGQYGVLYPLYAASVFIAQITGLGPARLADIIAVVHAALAGFMLFGLLRRLRAPTYLALGAAISATCGGYYLFQTSCLFFALPYLAWTAASMWAAVAVVDTKHRLAWPLVALMFALAMVAHLGHAQFTLYSAITIVAFVAFYLIHRKQWKPRVMPLAAAGIAAALLAMPTILPNWSILSDTGRAGAVSREAFGSHAIPFTALRGLILPTLRGEDGFSKEAVLFTVAGGAWCLPAIFAGLCVGRSRSRADRHLLWLMLGIVVIAFVLLIFAMGEHTPIYGWTYEWPIWSRLRWPYKWIGYVLPLLTIAAALSVMRLAIGVTPRRCRILLVVWLLGALACYVKVGLHTPWAIMATVASLVSVGCIALIHRPAAQRAFVVVILIECFCILVISQHPQRYKAYRDQTYDPNWAQRFEIDTDYRVMPGSPSNPPGKYLNELGLFEVATLDGYRSLTGGRWALTSSLLETYLPSHGEGHFPRHLLAPLLQSHLLRSYNTRYVIAHPDDKPLIDFLDKNEGWKLYHAEGVTHVYANENALPRAYFASHEYPGGDDAVRQGLINNQVPLRAAIVEDANAVVTLPSAEVIDAEWSPSQVLLKVNAPNGGTLVASMCYNPRWHAYVDGELINVQRTNGAVMSVRVPSGAKLIKLKYRDAAFEQGLTCALVGVIMLVMIIAVDRRRVVNPGS